MYTRCVDLTNKKFDVEKLPQHIGIIMDGNGRWAKKRSLPRKLGHKEGASAFKKIVRYCKDIGIKNVTFFAFSTENWNRPKEEVESIIELFRQYILEVRKHIDEEVRVTFLGDRTVFDSDLQDKMQKLEEDSKDFNKMRLILAINYGGRMDILQAVKEIAVMLKDGMIKIDDIDESLMSSMLYTKGLPDVDLIIRPSGEQRISNFLIWQSAYAELYFTDVLWPDFTPNEMGKALENYISRGRRFGGIV